MSQRAVSKTSGSSDIVPPYVYFLTESESSVHFQESVLDGGLEVALGKGLVGHYPLVKTLATVLCNIGT